MRRRRQRIPHPQRPAHVDRSSVTLCFEHVPDYWLNHFVGKCRHSVKNARSFAAAAAAADNQVALPPLLHNLDFFLFVSLFLHRWTGDRDRYMPGLAEGMEGVKAGETRDIKITFPDKLGPQGGDLEGTKAIFEVEAVEVKVRRERKRVRLLHGNDFVIFLFFSHTAGKT